MAFLNSMSIVGSGLTVQQTRLDVISENITNINTTRTVSGGAYRRKMVVLEAQENHNSFQRALAQAQAKGNQNVNISDGVVIKKVVEDSSDLTLTYDPAHPEANEDGYVEMPNVDLIKEITDAMSASQAYSANVTAFNTLKSVASKALEIGK